MTGDRPARLVVHAGHLLTMDPSVPDGAGSVVVHDGVIVAVGPDPEPALVEGAEVIDAGTDIVLPGLVDTHRHTWQSAVRHIGSDWSLEDYIANVFFRLAPHYRPEDAGAGTLLGALGALDAGITTLVDWSHIQNTPDHTDACIAALRAAGLRAVFAYGWPLDDPARWIGKRDTPLPADIRRARDVLADDAALVTMALAARGPEFTTLDTTANDLALARELDLAVTMHVGTGDYGPRYRGVERLAGAGLLHDRITLVHACTCSDHELRLAADAGATASVSPLIEMTMDGLGDPATGRLLAAGVRTGISVDAETATPGDLFTQMRVALGQHRLARRLDDAAAGPALTCRELLAMATVDGAAVAGLGDRTGSLTPGKRADLISITTDTPGIGPVIDPAAAVVLGAHPGLVRTVIVDGRIAKRDGRLTGPVAAALAAARASIDYLRRATGDLLR